MATRLAGLLARLRARAERDAIPLANLTPFLRPARRTRILRLALAAALVAAVVAAFASGTQATGRRFLPSSTVGIVVLDISSSIKPSTYDLIRDELVSLANTNERFGVVLFSDQAYEALPPGTPARELRPFVRFFDRRRPFQYDKSRIPLPRSPWEQWFSAGTSISSGLFLAAELLQSAHVVRGDVVLISDLVDDPSDYNRVTDALALYSERSIPLSIVALDPPRENRQVFEQLLGEKGVITDAVLPKGRAGRGELTVEAPFPKRLALFVAFAILLLGVEAYWAEPLRWRRAAR
jgi:hypothetical protein